nr:hypothetical protein C28F5.3 - Caenorhabditis elegans [Caenorhabditis elegans]
MIDHIQCKMPMDQMDWPDEALNADALGPNRPEEVSQTS